MPSVSNFPHLSSEEFVEACTELAQAVLQPESAAPDLDVEIVEDEWTSQIYLKICTKREVESAASLQRAITDHDGDELSDEDDEAALLRLGSQELLVEYHILLSPIYQVPVVYFFVHGLPGSSEKSRVEQVRECVVPPGMQGQMNSVGIMGAISYSDHPIIGVPAFFVHPCNTAKALLQFSSEKDMRVLDYMYLWLGIAGPGVGLSAPIPNDVERLRKL